MKIDLNVWRIGWVNKFIFFGISFLRLYALKVALILLLLFTCLSCDFEKKNLDRKPTLKILIESIISENLEKSLKEEVHYFFMENFPEFDVKITYSDSVLNENADGFDLTFSLNKISEESELISRKVFGIFTRYDNLVRNIESSDLEKIFSKESTLKNIKGEKTEIRFIKSRDFLEDFPELELSNPEFGTYEEVRDFLVSVDGENFFSVLPIELATPKLKVLYIDNVSFLGRYNEKTKSLERKNDFLENYPFKKEIWVSGSLVDKFLLKVKSKNIEFEIFSGDKISEITMTGVTAMGRMVYHKINILGKDFVTKDFENILNSSDIAMTSNEVSFVENCYQPTSTMSFCSPPNFLEVLLDLGIDVVELTGNHNNDYGKDWSSFSIDLYKEKGIKYYGGGKNVDDARNPAIFDIQKGKENVKIGFIGFNTPGPIYAFATENESGANPYNKDSSIDLVKNTKEEVDILIVGVQWQNENSTIPSEEQKSMSEALLKAGTDLVVGSQAHGYQGFEFFDERPVFYGLGNFIFDQMFSEYVRSGFALRVFVWDRKIKSFELIPYQIEDYCSPRLVSKEKEYELLQGIISILE